MMSNKKPMVITWIAITKLLIKQHGEHEDEEKSKDYMAMHVYQNNAPGERILSASNPIIKSTYVRE